MIYSPSANNKSRFILGSRGKNSLVFIGVNPSTATDKTYDPTIRKTEKFAKIYGYDSWIMINLYPKRTPDPNKLPQEMNVYLHNKNLKHIRELLKSLSAKPTILASWGNSILKREYLLSCLWDIRDETVFHYATWKRLGELTQKGHPRHPLFTSFDTPLVDFDIVEYLNKKSETLSFFLA